MSEKLDERYRVEDGFRMRGLEMTRIETFTDAAFAFAVTLLVVSVDSVPSSFAELSLAIQDVPAFLFSFLLLLMFWHGHWKWSRRYGLDDGWSLVLSAALVFIVLCYVYPLKFISALFMRALSGGYLSSQASISSVEELYSAFAIYAVGFVSMSLAILLLNLHSWRVREKLDLNKLERFDTRIEIYSWIILISVGLISLFVSLFVASGIPWPGLVYMSLMVIMPVFGVTMGKRRDGLTGTPEQPGEEKIRVAKEQRAPLSSGAERELSQD